MIQGFSGGLLNRELIYQTDLPSFQRDFASLKTLDHGTGPSITFTRASNATYFDADGVLQTASNNVARFDHDPATGGSSLGLLIEEARTNLLERSEEFDNAYWAKVSTTVTANDAIAPDGTSSADLVEKTGNELTTPARTLAVTAAAHTASCFVKNVSGDFFRIRFEAPGGAVVNAFFDTATGAVSTLSAGVTASIQGAGNGWYRCIATYTFPGAGNGTIGFSPANGVIGVDATGAEAHLWGAQLEAGAFATSYIPTTSAAATRAVDSAVVTPISSFYNQAEGTLFAEGFPTGGASAAASTHLLSIGNSSSQYLSVLRLTSGTTARGYNFNSPDLLADLNGGSFTASGKLAMAAKENDFAFSFNGGTVATDSSGTMPAADRMRIGSRVDTGAMLNGHIRRIAYWPRRLSNALLQSLTT
jgi:hypothetical protein